MGITGRHASLTSKPSKNPPGLYYKVGKNISKNVKRCRDDYAKKHSNKMPKSLQARCRNGGVQSGEGCMMAVNTSYTYISPHPYIFFTCHGNHNTNVTPSTYIDIHSHFQWTYLPRRPAATVRWTNPLNQIMTHSFQWNSLGVLQQL